MNDLRDLIFSSRKYDCLSTKQLRELYSSEHTIDGPTLGHIVSCSECLDAVNALLGLPRLQDRFPTDMTGNDMSGGSGGPPIGPSAFGGGRKAGIKRSMCRLRETFEHYPKELRIAVNGFVQVSQKVSSDLMEQTLSLDLDEKVGFVEIFSEQWIRLFFLEVEPPPEGSFEQQAHVDLSEGRSLKANLDFTGPCPHLQVVYHDPAQSAESRAESLEIESKVQSPKFNVQRSSERLSLVRRVEAVGGWLAQNTKNFGPWTLDLGLLSRPTIVTAFVALLITAAMFFIGPWSPSISLTASGLLAQSMKAEETLAARVDQVLHRTINLEERKLGGEVVARQRIEIWQSGKKGVTARRLYDERGTLVAGDWRTADGTQTLYHHGTRPQYQIRDPESAIRKSVVWQLDPSAKDFTALVDDTQNVQVQETAEAYVITYARSDLGEQSLAKATLTLSKSDLHATELKLILRSHGADAKSSDFNPQSAINNSQWTEFRLVETRFERRPIDAVAPAVFEVDLELVSSVEPATNLDLGRPSSAAQPPMPVMATAALEVEIIEALSNAGAFMGEQISVERADDGKIQVSALVETTERKKELLGALDKVKNNPAVRIGIETVAEAEARVKSRPGRIDQPTQPPTVERIEITEGESPVFSDLKKSFTDEEACLFSERVLRRSRQVWRHASAMKQLSQRFSQSDLQTLTDSERGRWLSLIRRHADSFVREAEGLRRELRYIFPEANTNPLPVGIVGGDAELQAKVRDLYDECVTIDRGMDRSFGVGASGAAPVKSSGFWAAFARALSIARSLQAVK